MRKIANPQDLQAELRRLIAYTSGPTPSRQQLAADLRTLAAAVEGADVSDMNVEVLQKLREGMKVRIVPDGRLKPRDVTVTKVMPGQGRTTVMVTPVAHASFQGDLKPGWDDGQLVWWHNKNYIGYSPWSGQKSVPVKSLRSL